MIERSLGLCPGAFNTVASSARTFDAYGGRELWLRDRERMAHPFTAIAADGIGIDTDVDATYDGKVIDLTDAWVRGLPDSADVFSRPYYGLELLPISSADPSTWPMRPASVRITATWGWAAVPGEVLELTVHLARDLIEGHLGGAVVELPTLEGAGGLPLTQQTWRIWRELRQSMSRKLPAAV